MAFFNETGYNPPGVYDREVTPTIITTKPSYKQPLCIVGEVNGNITFSEVVVAPQANFPDALGNVDYQYFTPLTQTNIIISTIQVSKYGSNKVSDIYVKGTHYNVIPHPDTINHPNEYVLVVLYEQGDTGYVAKIPAGTPLQVSYQYIPADFYEPKEFTSIYDIEAFYGPAYNSDGSINNPLALAARIANKNGLYRLLLKAVDPNGAGDDGVVNLADWIKAIMDLESYNFSYLVVLNGSAQLDSILLDLKNRFYAQNKWVQFFVGNDITYTKSYSELDPLIAQRRYWDTYYPTDYDAVQQRALNLKDQNFCLLSEALVPLWNDYLRREIYVPSYYMAVAIASWKSVRSPAIPLTRKYINGFYAKALPRLSENLKNQLTQAGLLVVENYYDGVRIRHGVTTDTTNVYTKEQSIVNAKAYMLERLYQALDGYIGQPINAYTIDSLRYAVTSTLNNLKSTSIIYDYRGLSVKIDEKDSTMVIVKFEYRPTYPLNYIVIEFAVNLTPIQI